MTPNADSPSNEPSKTSDKNDKKQPRAYRQADKNYKIFAKHLIKTNGDVVQAYQNTYPMASKATAQQRGKALVEKNPRAYNAIVTELENRGMNNKWFVSELKLLAKAKKKYKYDDEGKMTEVTENSVRLQAIKTALQLTGQLETAKTQVNINSGNQQINIGDSVLDSRQLKSLSDKLTSIHRALNFTDEQQDGIVDAEFSMSDGDDSTDLSDEEAQELAEDSDEGQ